MQADRTFDLAVIGGGVNGCGIARDAQGRGLSVFLAEMDDLASGTSSASTKLIHGGLRYLEYYEFRLVREALEEREVLLASAPHIIWPLRFVLPYHGGLRPWPVIRLGLLLYDHLGGRRILPPTRSVDLARDPTGTLLNDRFKRGFEYSDCWVEDSRLVVLNARDAADRGADIRTRTRCTAARRDGDAWHLEMEDRRDGSRFAIRARGLVNAAGPWASEVLSSVIGRNTTDRVRLVKGSHIVVDRIGDIDQAYIFQNADGRICFAIPYERDFTLIGTTDEEFHDDPATVTIDEAEIDYLLDSVNQYLATPVTRDTIRWSYSGVRPLYDDGASEAKAATRDYHLTLDAPTGAPPLLSVFGGKITTFRRLAEHAMEKLSPHYPEMGPAWTKRASLPGGDIPVEDFEAWLAGVGRRYPFLPPMVLGRLCRAYGTRIDVLLNGAAAMEDLGADFGAGLTERELEYLRTHEWAEAADDVLWRRSKLGLHLDPAQRAAVADYVDRPGMPAVARAG
ncbi:glycerol-3-phosphate dehydrogenase [Bauldia sp.]|uniref:glycerol-3-phosphate dehydrogenase n=1 Tax=Bauldia sp. TaxID=2575872 RepID=UPI003BA8C8CE